MHVPNDSLIASRAFLTEQIAKGPWRSIIVGWKYGIGNAILNS
jgi:hypothetical protein